MAEHINRDAFLEQQRAWYCKDCNRRKNARGKFVYEIGEAACKACDIGTMLDAVEDYPAADVVERKTGKWATNGDIISCPNCGSAFGWEAKKIYRYCPICGIYNGGNEDV